MSFEPNTGTKSPVICKLLEPSGNKPFDVRCRPHGIWKPGVPSPPISPVGINECEKLVAVLTFNQTQLGMFTNFVEKRLSPREFCTRAKLPPIRGDYAALGHDWSHGITCRQKPIPVGEPPREPRPPLGLLSGPEAPFLHSPREPAPHFFPSGHVAPEKSASERSALEMSAPDKSAPERSA